MKDNRILNGPIGKTLFSMTIPMVFGILAIVAMNLTDTFFVAQLGTEALAAMGFIFPVVLVVASFTTGLGSGVAAVISQAIGRGDMEAVQRLTKHSLLLGVILVGAMVGIGMLTIDPLFRALGADAETIPLIHSYMMYWYPGMLFLIIPMIGNSAIRATGDTRIPGYIMVNAAVINIILDPLFIFGIGPFPELGIAGAAVATIFARATSFTISLYVLHAKKQILSFHSLQLDSIVDSWKRILHIGLPAAATQLFIPVGMGIFTRLVAGFGSEYVAAVGTALRIEAFALVPVMALGATLMPFLGQNWGANNLDRVIQGIRKSGLFAVGWGLLCLLLYLMFSAYLSSIFSDNPVVTEALVVYLMITSIGYGMQGVSAVVGISFNAISQPMKSTVLTVLRIAVLFVPLAWLGGHYYGYQGLVWGAVTGNVAAGFIAVYWSRKTMLALSVNDN